MKEKNIAASAKLNWEVFAFLALYILLPDYFAVEFSQSLPLITASRVLILLMGAMAVIRRRDIFTLKDFRFQKLNLLLTQDKFLRISMGAYFVILILVNATFLLDTSEAIKQLFVMASEEYLVIWLLCMTIDSREKVVSALRVLVLSSGVCAVAAGISTAIDFNIFTLLNTVSRDMIIRPYYRYGMLRAVAGFHHAVYYGAYCAVMLPLCMYFVETTENKRWKKIYCACTVLDLLGLLLSNSRGSMLAFGCTAAVIFFGRMMQKSLKKLFATYLPLIAIAAALFLLTGLVSPAGRPYLDYIRDSVVDMFTPDPTEPTVDPTDPSAPTDPTEPTEEEETKPVIKPPEFGENRNGVNSRLAQLTGILYTMQRAPIFGFGPNAHTRGLVGYMYQEGTWSFLKTVDMNLVAIICQYGIIGLLGFLSLYGGMGIRFLKKKYRGDRLMQYFFLSFLCYMLCLASISFLHKWFWVFTGLFLCLVNVLRKESKNEDEI